MPKIYAKHAIAEVRIADIKPWTENPRGIDEKALAGLRTSLEFFGLVQLLVVNKRNMQLLSGHQRMRLLIEDGIESVQCVLVDLDDMAQQALAVSLNNDQIAGHFTEALVPILEKLRKEMPDEYINLRLQELREEVNQFETEFTGKTLPDDIPVMPKECITKRGDIWILGDHRTMCGDSTNQEDIGRLMDGRKAALMATDPPYLVDYTGKNRPGGGKDWTDVYHEIDIENAELFLSDFIKAGMKFTEDNSAFYIWHADRRLLLIRKIFDQLDILMHQNIIWVKPCSVLSFSVYPWRHEPCVFGWRRGYKPSFRVPSKSIGTVWTIDLLRSGDPLSPEYYSDIWELDWEGKKRNTGQEHPTVKPTEIFAIPMRVHTKPGDVCYEPFSGSGSQIIAAERLNRRCFAMEIEPFFVDLSIKRWEEFTGKKAQRAI